MSSLRTRIEAIVAGWSTDNGDLPDTDYHRGYMAACAAHAREVAAALAEDAGGWQSMDSAPRDGRTVDLWIEGADDTVDFYALTARKVPGQPKRHGRASDFRWRQHPPNDPGWYSVGGLSTMPLSPDVTPVAWRFPPPPPPTEAAP